MKKTLYFRRYNDVRFVTVRLGYVGYEHAYTPKALSRLLTAAGFSHVDFGILKNGMGYLFGEFWPAIPLMGRCIFDILVKLADVIEKRQNVVGGGSFAIGYKERD